jgi:hypothetical protein
MIAVVLVAVVLVLVLLSRIGDLVPGVLMLGTAALAVFVLPSMPGSPDACLNIHHGDPCHGHTTALIWLVFVIPICLAVVYKALRGDGRGTKGGRLP